LGVLGFWPPFSNGYEAAKVLITCFFEITTKILRYGRKDDNVMHLQILEKDRVIYSLKEKIQKLEQTNADLE